jgi:hypothetical protein
MKITTSEEKEGRWYSVENYVRHKKKRVQESGIIKSLLDLVKNQNKEATHEGKNILGYDDPSFADFLSFVDLFGRTGARL